MSTWTHVAGLVRIDAMPSMIAPFLDVEGTLKRLFGNTCTFEDSRDVWADCSVPCGSEGSLQYEIRETRPMGENGIPWGHVAIYGDLRSYDNFAEIQGWLLGVLKGIVENQLMVRSVSLTIECDGRVQCLYVNMDGQLVATGTNDSVIGTVWKIGA